MVMAGDERDDQDREQQHTRSAAEMAAMHIDDDGLEEDDDDDDDDTVVGNCLHCNSAPPSKNSNCSSVGAFTGGSGPCPASNPAAALSVASASSSAAAGAGRVQVSCDDCRSFICDGCHWCHEFQANHEIRVCDRCDAFYCRGCDEMDQCEDCSEVVCNTCSTLMSCKFCGCGLCEDCATACGRCGIVLCARDAKFAVDCDTCKMSYCLVCLASGTKDPCVRCGHRPSKRVEQLVHLRLKSIYKAFKQSGASVGPGGGSGGSGGGGSLGPGPPGTGSNPGSNPGNVLSGSGGCSHLADASGKNAAGRDISTIGGKYSSALRSLTENESLGLRGMDSSKDSFCNFDQSMANEVAAVLQTASNAMSNTDGGDFSDNNRRTRGKRISSHPSIAPNDHNAPPHGPSPGSTRSHRPSTFSEHSTSTRSSNSAAERYFRKTQAEMEAAAAAAEAEAEAAAASLLAELDEEKATSNASKKSKKKKKKKDKKKESTIDDVSSGSKANPTNIDSIDNASQTSASIEKNAEKTVAPQKSKPSKKSSNAKSASKESLFQEEDSTDDEDMNFEQLVVRSKTNSRPSKKEKKDEDVDENELLIASNKLSIKPALEAPVTDDPITDFDKELADLLSDDDEDGLENFLANLRGVPGLSALRKNAKKALKRIKEAKEASAQPEPEKPQLRSSSTHHTQPFMSEVELQPTKIVPKAALASINARTIPAATTSTAATNTTPSPSASTPHEPLLRVVSRTQSTVTAASSRGGGSNSASVPAAARAECVMHMSPSVVGWVIGKGGQRIRDMMEESGAKIWIDQESMGAKESRVVYVSGKRSAVDAAVRMVKDLVAKAPVAASAAAAQGMVPVPSVAATPASSIVKSSPPMVPATVAPPSTVQNPRPLEAGKDQQPIALSQQSLVAAISSNSSTPIALTSSGQKPSVTAKTSVPTQVWALPDSVGNIHEPSPQNIKIASKSSGAQAIEVAPLVKDQPKNLDSVSRGAEQLPGTMTKELVCDPRFVALLIGRRGWTVKNIQAESGANLHIDQSVEPPKIIISGNVGNVKKAEQLVREVLNYPQMQLNQEALGQNNDAGMEGMTTGALNVIDTGALLSSGLQTTPAYINGIHVLSTRSEHMAGDLRAKSDNSTILSMPMPANMHRDSLSSTPDLSDGRQLQNQHPNQSSAQAAETMSSLQSFPPGYTPYQQQNTLNLFQDSSSATALPNFLQNNQHHSLLPPSHNSSPAAHVDQSIRTQTQEWSQHGHSHLPPQYTSHSQYSMGQISASDHFLRPNPYRSAGHPPPHDKMSSRPPPFARSTDQNSHLMQNLEPSHLATMQPQQVPSGGMKDFLGAGNSNQSANGWGHNLKGAAIGESWNQTHLPSVAGTPQHPGFSQQSLPLDTMPTIPSNAFNHHAQNNRASGTPSNNHPISDDSQFVDSMFDSLGVPGGDGDGLLNALNSGSLGGAIPQQGNWGSAIAGWGSLGEEADSSSFLQNSRLGGIAMNPPQQDNHPHNREKR